MRRFRCPRVSTPGLGSWKPWAATATRRACAEVRVGTPPSFPTAPTNRSARSGPQVAAEPVSQARVAGQPVPLGAHPGFVEHGCGRVVVIARKVDVDLG